MKVLPCETSCMTHNEASSDTRTPRIATRWVAFLPMARPAKPATIAPTSGAKGTSRYAVFIG